MGIGGKRVFDRLGVQPPPQSNIIGGLKKQKVCHRWKAGNELPQHRLPQEEEERGFSVPKKSNPNLNSNQSSLPNHHGGRTGEATPKDMVCRYWMKGYCSYGDRCKYLHQCFNGHDFKMLTKLPAHDKGITAMGFPWESDKLYSGSKDASIKVWDCKTGQCVDIISMGAEIGCVMTQGPWLFVGSPNSVRAWNIQTNTDFSLRGAVGQVHAFAVGNDMLFAGTEDGTILAWRFSSTTTICLEPTASLKGHNLAVVSLVDGAGRLYSGSMDNTIRVWDFETLQCIHTLTDHKSAVTSVLCWKEFLLSSSLDRTIKVWAATEKGGVEVMYTHKQEHGVVALSGIHDAQAKPVLLCSCKNKIVHLYDLPSFTERGKIFSKEEVTAIEIGPGGLFFTGDKAGELTVWKMSEATPA